MSSWALAGLFVAAGVNHFVRPDGYASIIPTWLPGWLPGALALVYLSGVAEIGLGALVLTKWRRWAGWGLVLLLVAVYPANVFMALDATGAAALGVSEPLRFLLWLRLPLQGVLVGWVVRTCILTPSTAPRTATPAP